MQKLFEATRDNWPVDILPVYQWRLQRLQEFRDKPSLLVGAKEYYRQNKDDFILHWVDTFDPRVAGTGRPSRMPLIMFRKQIELCQFLEDCIEYQTGGLIEKCRDMGATWVCCGWSVASFLFDRGVSIGWGSRKEDLVDRIGDPDSIFEKMRMIIRGLPREFWPVGFNPDRHMTHMKIVNPDTESNITGEAGDNIGRGGRKLIYFKDESAHYTRPDFIEAALSENTNVQIDISSVNGPGNIFFRRRMNGVEWAPGQPLSKEKTNVFVMDWRDHPAKDQEWYDTRRAKFEADGLLHIFAQEVDRDYYAALEGTIIPAKWVEAAVDADVKLGIPVTGRVSAALDVADEGGDTNALSLRKGIKLFRVEEWGERDTGMTAMRAVKACLDEGAVSLEYDSIGVGAGVKAETNRLKEIGRVPRTLKINPWNAGNSPIKPRERVVPNDAQSPYNEDFYENLKAQAWWELRRRFEVTYRALTEDNFTYDPSKVISLAGNMRNLQKLKQELSQPTFTYSRSFKLMVDKRPDGTKSPNLADSVVMNFWPTPVTAAQRITVGIGG